MSFDCAAEYESQIDRGLRLSGDGRLHFMRERVRLMRARLGRTPRRILDFGCGLGDTTAHLAEVFPEAELVGVDTSASALEHARAHTDPERARFVHLGDFKPRGEFDLSYVNGVFHHIALAERLPAAQTLHAALEPSGQLAFFENKNRRFFFS